MGLEVFHHAVFAVGAADAAFAPAGVEALHAFEVVAVDVGFAKAEVFDRAKCRADVLGEDRGGQAVFAVVGECDGFVVVGEGQDGNHGAEDFFLDDFGVLFRADDDGGFVEVAFAVVVGFVAAGEDLGSGVFGAVDHFGDFCLLGAVDLRRVDDAFGEGVAEFDGFHRGGEFGEKFVVDVFVNVGAFGTVADLSAEDDAGVDDAFDGGVDVGVVEDNRGGFAAEFEGDFGDVGGAGADDFLSGFDAAGERHHVGEGAGDECVAEGFAGAGDDVEDAFGEVGFGDEFGEFEGGVGRVAAGFDDDGAAGEEGGGDFARHYEEGKIPRADAGDNADGLAEEEDVFVGAVALDNFAFVDAGPAGVVVEVVGGEVDFHLGEGEDFGLFLDEGFGEFDAVFADEGGELFEVVGACRGGEGGPCGLGFFGGGEGFVRVGVVAFRNAGDDLAGVGIFDFDPLGGVGVYEGAVDELLVGFHCWDGFKVCGFNDWKTP